MKTGFFLAALLASTSLAQIALPAAHAAEADSFAEAITSGDATLDFRYRLELVDQAGIANNATASTLRTRLGYKTGSYNGMSGFVQFENVVSVGNQNFNSTVNGNATYPVVADPPTTELNQAWLRYEITDGFAIKAGREAINLGNQRFIGTVGWRQNDQTYDNINLVYSKNGLTFVAAHVEQVNRIFSHKHALGELETNTNLFHAEYKFQDLGTATGYAYLVDLDNPAVFGLSRNTYGVRMAGSPALSGGIKFAYELEYAQQNDAGQNPTDFSAKYLHGSAGLSMNGWTVAAGLEKLGSDNSVGFATPLATLHKFNGWADKFLGTPANGLKDVYVKLGWKAPDDGDVLKGVSILAFYHNFTADVGNLDYGSEIDWQISKPFGGRYALVAKGAHYSADTFGTDTDKFWFMLTAKF